MLVKLKVSILLVIFLLSVSPARAEKLPAIKAQAAILMDVSTGEVLFEKNMSARNAPASTTKILTAIIAIESGRLEEKVKVSDKAAATSGSSMHLYAGQILSLRELLTGLLLRSGNDAAVAIAEHLAGSVDNFAAMMNNKAQELGAVNSHFRNPHGLTAPGHYCTALDLALITRYALTNPLFNEIVRTKETSIEWFDRRGREKNVNLRNTNKLLWMFEEADGVKTGTTNEAGPCLVSSATRGNQRLIAVVLHDHNRWYDSMQLLKYGFDTFDLFEYAGQGDVLAAVPVEGGLANMVDCLAATPAALVTSHDDYEHVTVETELPEKIKAPVFRGQKVGEIVFFVRDKAVKTVDVVAAKNIEEQTPGRIFLNSLLKIFRLLSNWGLL